MIVVVIVVVIYKIYCTFQSSEYSILFLVTFLASFLSRANAFFVRAVSAIDAFLARHHIAKDVFNPAVRVQLAPALFTRNEMLLTPFALFAGHVIAALECLL